MSRDPHAMMKITTCTSLEEMRGLLDAWVHRGVELTEPEQRCVDEKRAAFLAVEREARRYRG